MSPHTKQVWTAPAALALLTLLGLTSALLSDGWPDVVSWLALSAPAAACLYFPLRRRAPSPARRPDPRPAGLERRTTNIATPPSAP
jgi:hypothetical protein